MAALSFLWNGTKGHSDEGSDREMAPLLGIRQCSNKHTLPQIGL